MTLISRERDFNSRNAARAASRGNEPTATEETGSNNDNLITRRSKDGKEKEAGKTRSEHDVDKIRREDRVQISG